MTAEEAKTKRDAGEAKLKDSLQLVEKWLKEGKGYIGDHTLDKPTIADLLAYCELGQLRLAHLFDFKDYPSVTKWLDTMAKVSKHDETHQVYNGLIKSLEAPKETAATTTTTSTTTTGTGAGHTTTGTGAGHTASS